MLPFGKPKQIKKQTVSSFNDLIDYLDKLDPIKLITQLTLTYLFYPGGEFKPEHDKIHKWSRWLEFICGYLLSRPYSDRGEEFVDGRNLDALEKLLEKYFMNIAKYVVTERKSNGTPEENQLLAHLKLYSLNVRGDTYPNRLLDLSQSLYSQHSKFFKRKYGFTIDEAIQLHKAIRAEYEKRVNERCIEIKQFAKEITEDQIKQNKELQSCKADIEISNFFKLFFGMSDIHLSFTLSEIIEFSNFPRNVCSSFLNRLSQKFGYKNPKYPKTFTDAFQAPWDYNTLYERPIVCYVDKYFVPNPAIFTTALLNTFHYDLISDTTYQTEYNEIRGKWLEKRTADALCPLFGSENVILNPQYPNGDELTDVLVLYDRKIFIIQCKSKNLRYESKTGQDFEKLKEDIEKGIESSFAQAVNARNYLLGKDSPEIFYSSHRVVLDTQQVTHVFLLSVTLGYYQSLVTRFANIDTTLKLFKENDYPWAISISDLEVITEIINRPSEFAHYTKQRIKLEKTNFEVAADEIDLLNFYLSEGLNFVRMELQEYDQVILTGFSSEVDQYFYEKYELQKDVAKPKREMPDEIENLNVAYKSECIDKLLLLNKDQQKSLVKNLTELKRKAIKHQKLQILNLLDKANGFGISIIYMNAKNDLDNLYHQIFSYSILQKYEHESDNWVGLGSDINSSKNVDMAVYISFPWVEDAGIEQMIKERKK